MLLTTRLPFFAGTACLLATVFSPRAHADTLSWGTSGYTYNATTQVGTPSDTNKGGNVGAPVNGNQVSILYDTGAYFNNTYNNTTNQEPSPGVGTNNATTTLYTDGGTNNGTQGTGSQALQIFANFDNGANIIKGAGITVTVFFSKPVSGLLFSFWDVDTNAPNGNSYTDLISNLHGQNGLNGTSIAPSTITNGAVTPTSNVAPNGAANSSNISATSATITGTGSAIQGAGTPGTGIFNASSGRSTVQFGSTPIDRFSFVYTDPAAAAGGSAHSSIQIIGLSDLQFTTVPEPSTWALVVVGGLAGAWTLRRRARRMA